MEPLQHVVLLGDSIFDNASYVPNGLPVIDLLRQQLPAIWQVRLLAVDGDVSLDVLMQLKRLPEDATHLVISCGGNDALQASGVVNELVATVNEALDTLANMRDAFRRDYRQVLVAAMKTDLPVAVCTIYDAVPGLPRELQAALALFNEVILFEAAKAGLAVIDLRVICDAPKDYSEISVIEPSEPGGIKIAAAIARLLTRGFSLPGASVIQI